MLRQVLIAGVFLVLAACSTAQNVPLSNRFPPAIERPAEASVFFDINGTLYPDGWRDRIPEQVLQRNRSLLNGASETDRAWIADQEDQHLQRLARLIAGRDRVFILIHGFNINEAEAAYAFDLVESRIAFTPRDVVIRVHWDGMIGSGLGVGRVWFPAAGYSQVVGVRGLRRILNLASGQNVYLISHSRGASVILSALANPPFTPGFRRATASLPFAGPSFLRPPALMERHNHIRAIFLAPAIGYPDFWDASCETARDTDSICQDPPQSSSSAAERQCPQYRIFSPQLQSIRYTTNSDDTVLEKRLRYLSRHFNATDLGFNPAVGQRLAHCYPGIVIGRPIARPHPHAFRLYAQDPELAEMLRADGVESQ